jgi:hypothetical protein
LDIALTRKLAGAIQHLELPQKRDAVLSLLGNIDLLYPVLPSIMVALHNVVPDLEEETQDQVAQTLLAKIQEDSHLFKFEIHLAYVLRVLGLRRSAVGVDILTRLYSTRRSALVRRCIILIMAGWGEWHWVSDIRNSFPTMQRPERRAFIVASYALGDEGRHWRQNMKAQFDGVEQIVAYWASQRRDALRWELLA